MQITSATATSTNTDTNTDPSVPTTATNSLSMDDFMTLLVKQMTTQDPMNPQTDSAFAAEMAQFASLQSTQSMQSDLSSMRSSQALTQASSMVGQTVQVQVDSSTTDTGVVSAVQVVSGTPKLVINGQNYDLSQVLSVTPTTIQN